MFAHAVVFYISKSMTQYIVHVLGACLTGIDIGGIEIPSLIPTWLAFLIGDKGLGMKLPYSFFKLIMDETRKVITGANNAIVEEETHS